MSVDGDQRTEARRLRALGAGGILVGAFWSLVALYALHPALSFNPLHLPFETNLRMQRWTPEGWKFFTRNPREDHALLLGRDEDGTWRRLSLGPNFTLRNYLGFGRLPRAQGIELGLLMHNVPKGNFVACSDAPEKCLDSIEHSVDLVNHSPEPTLCGTVGFIMQKQVPWAWALLPLKSPMASRVMRLEVKCSG
jgi:antimicrobial peptide system SdpA family protein